MQGLAAVEAAAEGDEDDGVGRPHGRPGRAGPPQRVLHSLQAPGPDPAHYHRGSCGPSRPGWEGRGDGGGEGQGGRDKEGNQWVSRRGLDNRDEDMGEEELASVRNVVRQGREVKGGMGCVLEGGRSRARGGQQTQRWEGNVGPTESEMEKSFVPESLPLLCFPGCLTLP